MPKFIPNQNPFKFTKKDSLGFTLVELLVAITIVSILIGIIMSSGGAALRFARNQQRKSDVFKITQALQAYYSDYGYYPLGVDNKLGTIPFAPGAYGIDWKNEGLNGCSGNPNPCDSNRVYLPPGTHDPTSKPWLGFPAGFQYAMFYDNTVPHDIHYCYISYSNQAYAKASPQDYKSCDNTTKKCQYFYVVAELEDQSLPGPFAGLGAHKGLTDACETGHYFNYALGPN